MRSPGTGENAIERYWRMRAPVKHQWDHPGHLPILLIKIGRLWDQYGIPFFYRQPMVIYDRGKNALWELTFILPSYGCLVVDYLTIVQVSCTARTIAIRAASADVLVFQRLYPASSSA